MRPQLLILAVVAALAGTVAGVFFLTHEKVEVEEQVGPRGRARTDRYLAAARMLEKLGVPTQSRTDLDELPPEGHTLVLLDFDASQRRALRDRLFEWVKGGGHLVVQVLPPAEDGKKSPVGDPLLDPFGIRALEGDGDVRKAPREAKVFVDRETSLTMSLPSNLSLSDDEEQTFEGWLRKAEGGEEDDWVMARVSWGDGQVSVVTDVSVFTNTSIGKHDHAEAFWRLVGVYGDAPEGVWLVRPGATPSVLAALAERGDMAMTGLTLFLVAMVMHLSSRFGPLLPTPELERRRLVEHVLAAGHFVWKHRPTKDVGGFIHSVRQEQGKSRRR